MLGIDDAGFNREKIKLFSSIPVYGVIMKNTSHVEGIIQTEMKLDSMEITNDLINLIKNSAHYKQLQVIFLNSITIGGFGLIDVQSLFDQLEIPIIVVMRKFPNYKRIKLALKNLFPDSEYRWDVLQKAGKPEKISNDINVYFQVIGIEKISALEIYNRSKSVGFIPEVLRIAHLIGASYYRFMLEKEVNFG